MRLVLLCALFATACTPRLAVTVRQPARVQLGPVKTLAVLTHPSRLGVVMRERVRHDLARDAHFTLVAMCGDRSCEPVDAFLRLYERDARLVPTQAGQQMVVVVDTDLVAADGRPLVARRERTRAALVGGEAPQKVTERLVNEVAGECAQELFHPRATEWLVFDDGAPFKLGITQALDGRLPDARRTFESMIENNPQTAGAYFNLALVLEAQGELELARRNYEKANALTSKPEYQAGLAAFERRVAALKALSAPARQ
ncbi:MAG: hypothetical protein JNJ54_11910 [Myxococcaceae bacterium]|nr:hypothetical protein [Myxococcaceae bacterium]